MDKRKFIRFLTPLKVKVGEKNKTISLGLIKDFSRDGLSAVFDDFDFKPNSSVDLKIQKPNEDIFIAVIGEVVWKKCINRKWEVGLRLKEFPPRAKAEILDYAYKKWLKDSIK